MVRKNAPRILPDSPVNLVDYLDRAGGGRFSIAPDEVFAAYAHAAMRRDPGLAVQLADQLRAQPQGVRLAVAGRAGPGNAAEGLYRQDAPGAQLDGVFGGVGEFARALRGRVGVGGRGGGKLDQVRSVMNSFGSEVSADGGLLVPEELRSELVLLSLEQAIIRPRAINVPMGTLRTGVPAIDDTTHASSIMGAFVAYWTEEAAAVTESQAAYERIFLDAKALKAYGTAPNELMSDAPAFDVYLRTVVPAAMAWYEDHGLIKGDGVGEPQGVLNAPCQIKVTRGTANKVLFADVIGMLPRMLPASLNRAVWLCSPDVLTQLLQLYLAVGSVTTQGIAPPGWLTFDGARWRLLGLPLFPTEHVPALGTTGDLILFDPGMFLLGTRALMQMDVSPHYKFAMDVSAIRIRTRVDGRMWPQSSLTPANSSQTVSAVVVLN